MFHTHPHYLLSVISCAHKYAGYFQLARLNFEKKLSYHIIDLFSNMIVQWQISKSPHSCLIYLKWTQKRKEGIQGETVGTC